MTLLTRSLKPLSLATALTLSALPAVAQSADIVDTAVAAGDFTTLAAALEAAGLVETLKGEGPFTVFAPTDAAFAALPAGTVEDLLKPENKDQLTAVLTYHVVAGKVMSGDLSDGMKAATVNGAEVTITTEGGAKVNGANITSADIAATNGVIHVIDAVILPPAN
ncbi:fasciclin domain-containing protein [Albidovulum sediminis]|uniref:Fasciclin domain-containing protein n=1 Tax=Albidovulum sediminis TaxID=3066345 RepID=A0ABT2NHU8_9RHOB|nr:fasciclin domain-containing protein [Defluviimonas sediminis]MCT8328495.1 fasciclin domain-containing protein [Defluviimonas sediminis]